MSIRDGLITGVRITSKPTGILKCGFSRAKFANDCKTQQWYELSIQGGVIGTPTDFDFYRKFDGDNSHSPSGVPSRGLVTV